MADVIDFSEEKKRLLEQLRGAVDRRARGSGGASSGDLDWELFYTLSHLACAYAHGMGEEAAWISSPVVQDAFVVTNLDDNNGLLAVFGGVWRSMHRYQEWLSTEPAFPEVEDQLRWAIHSTLKFLVGKVLVDLRRKGLAIGALDPNFTPPAP